MVPTEFHDVMLTPGIIQSYDPPEIVSGMVHVELDPQGRLIHFLAIPPEVESSATAASSPIDWSALFAFAGLDQRQFQSTQPVWNTLAGGDTRVG
jgi:hypothetical protein